MHSSLRLWTCALLAVGGLLAAPSPARAETFHTCAGFIDSVPTTISTQGVWCLRHDLSTSITSGGAILVASNNVTIDCNGFKLGGLAAGDASEAIGIDSENRQNTTVRHCNIRGFREGISLAGSSGGGHLVEDNRLDNNLVIGISMDGANNMVRRNQVFDTGGAPDNSGGNGIVGNTEVIDNIVVGVFGTNPNTYPNGIFVIGEGHQIRGNHVGGLLASGTGYPLAIRTFGSGTVIAANHVNAASLVAGSYGILGDVAAFCIDNTVRNYANPLLCNQSSGNLVLP